MVVEAIGIDLAKSVFSLYGIDDHGKCVLRKTVKRHQLSMRLQNNQRV